MSDLDARQWTLQREPDRNILFGPYTGDEKVTVVPISRLAAAKVELVPDAEARLLKVNEQQADRIKALGAENARQRETIARLREGTEGQIT